MTEDEMILAFLRGEVASSRFGDAVRSALVNAGGLNLIARPDLASTAENAARRSALDQARGYSDRTDGLFNGFPAEDITWSFGTLEPDEVARVRFIDYSYWVELSGGSRRPCDVRSTIERGELPEWMVTIGTDWCFDLARLLRDRSTLSDLVIVGTPGLDELVVLEGHARLTALFVGRLDTTMKVTAFVGTAPNIHGWRLF